MKNSISLIGMAGAGKTSVGKELARTLGFSFIDSDALIEKQHGKSLQNILDDEGYIKLREIENIALKSIQFNKTILSTGGSAVYSDEAMEHIQQNSKVIFLEVPFSQILERVPSFLDRGFAKAPNQSVENAFGERQELYKKYSDSVVSNTKDLNSCVSKILELL
ncbi:shikimate kinase [Gammaproteobacteria bacterium]|jgi:shikimate kinase|nr:shikimate kinase [Gammaproteobacteria bacterium]MDA8798535.1 shikimate kinase [Gammaproteobacteria bacterium]MDA9965385.1 shikimate kinase [Gammaproteobacteria bacterium]MDB2370019.1 shikimate kinase [Gammaproteobacteria bacterium]MDB2410915.1 shikimate kinase [Gammaproteobacteria bacterium]